jgi:DNA replication protein DnaC
MNAFTELTPMLKTLRLSGMLDSLDARNRQAITEHLAPTEFLTLLIQDELARRDQHKLTQRLRRAAFHSAKTIEQFDFNALPNLNRSVIHDLMTCRFVAENAPVLITGPTGTGKSHLAQAIGHQAVRQGHDVFFATQSQLLGSLTRARLSGVYERRMKMLINVGLLVIDDFGLKPIRSPQDDDLHEIIAARYERSPVIVTSNLDVSEWGEAFADNKLLGAATIDRLNHGAYRVVLDGETYRKPRALNEQKTAVANAEKTPSAKTKNRS